MPDIVRRSGRRLLVPIVLAVLALGGGVAPAFAAGAPTVGDQWSRGGTNLLTNSGFERSAVGGGAPAAWTADTEVSSSTLAWDDGVSHSGRHSVRIQSPTPADVWWVQTVDVRPHTLYRLSGWIKTRDVARSPEVRDSGANISLLGTFDRTVAVLGTRDWTQVAVTLDSADLTQLTVAARLGFWGGVTAGTAWFDDLRLTQVSTTDRIVNGGFERGAHLAGAIPQAWGEVESQSVARFTWDRTVAHSGDRSARISATAPDDAMWAQSVVVRPHTLYRLSGWIRTRNVAPSTETVNPGANLSFLGTFDRSDPVLGTQGWTFVSVTTDSGDQTQLVIAARLGFWGGQTTGTAWFDDLTLTPLGCPIRISPGGPRAAWSWAARRAASRPGGRWPAAGCTWPPARPAREHRT